LHALDSFGSAGDFLSANKYTACVTTLGGDLTVSKSILGGEKILAESHIISATGHFSSAQADSYSGLIPALTGTPLSQAQAGVALVDTLEAEALALGAEDYTELDESFYSSNQQGNTSLMTEIGFSFRTPTQYGTGGFKLYETRWQQLARLWSAGAQVWTELFVIKSGEETAPFPGKERLEAAAFVTQNLTLFDIAEGVSKDRSDVGYEAPAYGAQTDVVLNSAYLVISPFI
jgi:hypothetical protein